MRKFGWRGLVLEIPEDWELIFEKLEKNAGFFRLEDATQPQIEVYWEKIPFEKMPNIEDTIEKILKKIFKKKKAKIFLRKKINIRNHEGILLQLYPPKGKILQTQTNKVSIIHWYCEKSEKLYTIFFLSSQNVLDFLNKIDCHPAKNYWTFYGFTITLPEDFNLVHYKVTTGLSTARFYRKKDNSYVIIFYNSMANIILEEYYSSIEDWFKENVQKVLEKYFGKMRKKAESIVNIQGHKAKLLIFEKGLPLRKKIKRERVYLWVCNKTNRLYALITLFSEMRKELQEPSEILRIINTINCHV